MGRGFSWREALVGEVLVGEALDGEALVEVSFCWGEERNERGGCKFSESGKYICHIIREIYLS